MGDNRFVIEFESEKARNFVLRGGPWIYHGDAVIVVPYDGRVSTSGIKVESIALWVRILDLPEYMMNNAYAEQLGRQLGKVIEKGEAVRNFLSQG